MKPILTKGGTSAVAEFDPDDGTFDPNDKLGNDDVVDHEEEADVKDNDGSSLLTPLSREQARAQAPGKKQRPRA